MSLLVLSYPDIEKKHCDWIQTIRKENDELYYNAVAPHFTLVFPVFNYNEEEFIQEIIEKTKGKGMIYFSIKGASVVKDSLNEYWHTFLVPDEGGTKIVELHDSLYSGKLLKELRTDIPFVPHVGIGNSRDPMSCKKLADKINSEFVAIHGKIKQLDIVRYENNKVETIHMVKI